MNSHLKMARTLTYLLENQFKFGRFKFGLDPVLGLVPGFGDAISATLALYIVWIAINSRVPQDKIILMLWNIVLDFLLGLLPLIGDVADFAFKSNSINLEILEKYHRDFSEGSFTQY